MNTHVGRKHETQAHSTASAVTLKKSGPQPAARFADNRLAAAAQRARQETADNSLKHQRLAQLHAMSTAYAARQQPAAATPRQPVVQAKVMVGDKPARMIGPGNAFING